MIDAVYASCELYHHVVIAVYLAHCALCALERSEGMVDSAVAGIIPRRRYRNRNRRGSARLCECRRCAYCEKTSHDYADYESAHFQRSTSSMRKRTSSPLYSKLCRRVPPAEMNTTRNSRSSTISRKLPLRPCISSSRAPSFHSTNTRAHSPRS